MMHIKINGYKLITELLQKINKSCFVFNIIFNEAMTTVIDFVFYNRKVFVK